MKRLIILVQLLLILCCQSDLNATPAEEFPLQNSVEDDSTDYQDEFHDFNANPQLNTSTFTAATTTDNGHPLASDEPAAPCLVRDVVYKHGDQIKRSRPCDYCLCIDGDMFCYWQCATTSSPTTNSTVIQTENDAIITANIITSSTTTEANPSHDVNATKIKLVDANDNGTINNVSAPVGKTEINNQQKNIDNNVTNSLNNNNGIAYETEFELMNDQDVNKIKTNPDQTNDYPDTTSSMPDENLQTQQQNGNKTVCVSKGNEYQIGEILPKDTEDSCLECVCTEQLNVTCSPKNCANIQQDSNYKHEIGSDAGSMDMFDVDTF